ncbi:MAG: hemerythrin domain-containing protein, partial [Candidatus Atribacteria bacterium]|nr:hemerythrin domain-containing protein [Candidatus Atribacteria bacterium]
MKPRGLLMAEHRLIERMISMVEDEAKKIKRDKPLNVEFIDVAVDFIRTYADRTHHGKEEEILFRDCAKKEMSKEDRYIMDGLIQEHQYSRNTLKELIAAKEKYLQGDRHQ